jgi:hypothetical protein
MTWSLEKSQSPLFRLGVGALPGLLVQRCTVVIDRVARFIGEWILSGVKGSRCTTGWRLGAAHLCEMYSKTLGETSVRRQDVRRVRRRCRMRVDRCGMT